MCVHKYGLWMLWRNGRRLLCLLLAVMAVAVSANDANTYDSTVFVNKDVVVTDSSSLDSGRGIARVLGYPWR